LRDVTLFLPPGETTFIVGGSGSGKSTVAQLLLRLYTPVGGEITLDDQSIAYLDDGYTKENIAAVQQGCILFDMSVHDNVAMGLAGAGVDMKTGIQRRPRDVTRGEVEEACRMAMIHDFISGLPEGYETVLGTGGSSLSGGQRQRLAIARARIRDPTILVLGTFSFLGFRTLADQQTKRHPPWTQPPESKYSNPSRNGVKTERQSSLLTIYPKSSPTISSTS
jgi:ATP-binding cassette subfamily B (MDR/TAP) protein 1